MIELGWTDFKSQVLTNENWYWTFFDVNNHYHIYAKQNSFTVLCKIYKDEGENQLDFESNYKESADTSIISRTETRFEREDLRLSLACGETTFSGDDAEVSIKVPGTPGSGDGRFIGGGYATIDFFYPGDKVTQVNIVDADNILGYGAHTVVATYHDSDVDEENQGWFTWAAPGNTGEVEIDPMGYYGFVPSGLYLEIYFKKKTASSASKALVNIWWAKATV